MAIKFKKVKSVNLPVLKVNVGKPVYVQIDGPLHIGKEIKGDKKAKGPATLLHVTNLESGEEMQIVVGTVLKGILEDGYENEGYVGKCFSIEKHAKLNGREYHQYTVLEIEPVIEEDDDEDEDEAA
jgi:hypothetical protein